MATGSNTSRADGGLAGFWDDAGIPAERRPYLAFQARRYASIGRFLARHGPWKGRTVLDLGGGVGSLSVYLAATLGGEYHLSDFFPPSPALAEALRARGVTQCYPSDLTRPEPLAPSSPPYDAILFVEVLEHLLVNPVLLFRRLAAHLAPGGLLFLTTPNQARLTNRWKLLRGRSIKDAGRYPLDDSGVYGHVVEYTTSELDVILHYAGFDGVETEVVQQVPAVKSSPRQRWGVRLLNSPLASRARWGDDILALYRRGDRATPPDPPGGRV